MTRWWSDCSAAQVKENTGKFSCKNLTVTEFPALRWKVWARFKSDPAVADDDCDCKCFDVRNLPDGDAILDNHGIMEPIGRSEKFC